MNKRNMIVGIILILLALAGIAGLAFGQSPLYVGPGTVSRMAVWNAAQVKWLPLMLAGVGVTPPLYTGPGDVARLAYWTGTEWKEWNGTVPAGWLTGTPWTVWYVNAGGTITQLPLAGHGTVLTSNSAVSAPFFGGSIDTVGHRLAYEADSALATQYGVSRGIAAVDLQLTHNATSQVAAGDYSVLVGGIRNKVWSNYGFLGGGSENTDTNSNYSVLAGGISNRIYGSLYGVIAGGSGNKDTAAALGFIGGGASNTIYYAGTVNNYGVIGGGYGNVDSAEYGVIGGGDRNVSKGDYNFIGSGQRDSNLAHYSVIGGGLTNKIHSSQSAAFIGGGELNMVYATGGNGYSLVVGGYANTDSGDYSALVGGQQNQNRGDYSFVGGGEKNNTWREHSVAVGGYNNRDSTQYGFIGGGYENKAVINKYGFVGGGRQNYALGDSSNTIAGGRRCSIATGYDQVIVGGYLNNIGITGPVTAGMQNGIVAGINNSINNEPGWNCPQYGFIGAGSTNVLRAIQGGVIVGGGGNFVGVTSSHSSIVGGQSNRITGATNCFIGGGLSDTVLSTYGVIAGGYGNHIATAGAGGFIGGGTKNRVLAALGTISGGTYGVVSGVYGTIPGGDSNQVRDSAGIAMGKLAIAKHARSAEINLTNTADSTNENGQFRVNAPGGLENRAAGGWIYGDTVFGYTNSQWTVPSFGMVFGGAGAMDTTKIWSGDSIYIGLVYINVKTPGTVAGGDSFWVVNKAKTDSSARCFVPFGTTYAAFTINKAFPRDTICCVTKMGGTTVGMKDYVINFNYGTCKRRAW